MSRTYVCLSIVVLLALATVSASAVSFYPLPQPAVKGVPEAEQSPTNGVAVFVTSWELAAGTSSVDFSGTLVAGQFAVGQDWIVGGAFNSIRDGTTVEVYEGNVTYRLPKDWGVQAGLIDYDTGTDYMLCGVKSFRDKKKDAWQADLGLGWYGAEMVSGGHDSGVTAFLSGGYNVTRNISVNATVWSISLPGDMTLTRSGLGVGYRF